MDTTLSADVGNYKTVPMVGAVRRFTWLSNLRSVDFVERGRWLAHKGVTANLKFFARGQQLTRLLA